MYRLLGSNWFLLVLLIAAVGFTMMMKDCTEARMRDRQQMKGSKNEKARKALIYINPSYITGVNSNTF